MPQHSRDWISQNIWGQDYLQHTITVALYLIVCLCWGTTWLAIEIAVESSPPLTAAGLRFIIAAPMLFIFAGARQASIFYPAGQKQFFYFITLFYFALPYWLLNFGEQYVSSGLTALLFSTMPIFILFFSWWLLKERIYLSQILGIITGFSGLTLILINQDMYMSYSGLIGVAAILVAAIMHGFCYVLTKKTAENINTITFNALPIGVSGLLLLSLGIIIEKPQFASFSSESIFALFYLGIVASVGGFIVYFYLLKRMSPIILSFVFIIWGCTR
ncbi:DMT family transporter [Alphaproteobacteria bacterium LSUCC0684]